MGRSVFWLVGYEDCQKGTANLHCWKLPSFGLYTWIPNSAKCNLSKKKL